MTEFIHAGRNERGLAGSSPVMASPVPIHRSKLERPLVSGQYVARPALEGRLDRVLQTPLTIVAAPAGHGKTRTLVEWLARRELDAAWLTLSERDRNLTRFAAHLAAALDRAAPGVAAELLARLSVPDRLSAGDLGEAFGDSMFELRRDLILVLDDFHTVDHDGIAAFVEGLVLAAPARLHVILSTRHKPSLSLTRLRVTGQVEELTGSDFRFSVAETAALLRLEADANADPELAAHMHAAVGGWPAAVRLLVIGVGAGGAHAIARTLTDAHGEQLVLDYLSEEVLSRIPSQQRHLLLCASLPEHFNGHLLEVLTHAGDDTPVSRGEIQRLRALDLYREVPALEETWFAYHPLFRGTFLRQLHNELGTEAVANLHHVCADWFAAEGLTRQAVWHLVQAGDVAAAAALIESRLSDAFAQEEWQSVAAWLRQIPREEMRQRSELLLAAAWIAYLSGRGGRRPEMVTSLRELHGNPSLTPAQRAELDVLAHVGIVPIERDPRAAVQVIAQAIPHIPASKRYRVGMANMALALALNAAGREGEAQAQLATFTTQQANLIDAATIRGYFGRVLILWQSGALTTCERAAADLLQLAISNALPISAGWGRLFLGCVAHERGELDQALGHFAAVIADAYNLHFWCVNEAFCGQTLAFEALGKPAAADRAVARQHELVISVEEPSQIAGVDALAARIALMRGDVATATRWLAASMPMLDDSNLLILSHPLLTRIKALIAVGTTGALAEAEQRLSAYLDRARGANSMLALLEGLAVSALLHEARAEPDAAVRRLRESLAIAAPEGIVQRYAYLGPALAPILRRLLAEPAPAHHARSVLAALEAVLAAHPGTTQALATRQPDLPETPLTDREREVLGYLAQRLTNNEIGDALFISSITVKHHIANLSGKLGVSGRRAAVARASELGLLD